MLKPPEQVISGRNVNIEDVDPETMARFYAANAKLKWRLGLVSAARSRAQQVYLYRGWRAGKPGFNLAANPDWRRPDGSFGSRHMVQATGFSYALDLRRLRGITWLVVHRTLKAYGLRFTVGGEAWHCQALRRFAGGRPDYWPVKPKKEAEIDVWRKRIAGEVEDAGGWHKVARFVKDCTETTLRRGDAGPAVAFLQKQLNGHNAGLPKTADRWPTLALDGKFGPGTEAAVRAFQADEGLAVDAVVGPKTWERLLT